MPKKPEAPKSPSDRAVVEVTQLLMDKFKPESLDQLHEYLKLLGIVIGQFTLLEMATASVDDKARVAAARALLAQRDRPEDVAERLRRSPFAHLSIDQLQAIIHEARLSGADAIQSLIERAAPHASPPKRH